MEDVKKLTVSQKIALEAVQADLARTKTEAAQAAERANQATLRWRSVMIDCGLDVNKTWRVRPDGGIEEMPQAIRQRVSASAPEPSGNGNNSNPVPTPTD